MFNDGLAMLQVPVGPLVEQLGDLWPVHARARGLPAKRVSAWQVLVRRGSERGTLSVYAADDICINLLGMHPAAVWGPLWYRISGTTTPEHRDAHYRKLSAAAHESNVNDEACAHSPGGRSGAFRDEQLSRTGCEHQTQPESDQDT
jgi:hypothetical protein